MSFWIQFTAVVSITAISNRFSLSFSFFFGSESHWFELLREMVKHTCYKYTTECNFFTSAACVADGVLLEENDASIRPEAYF